MDQFYAMCPAASELFGWFVHRVEDECRIMGIDAEVALRSFRRFIPPATLMEL